MTPAARLHPTWEQIGQYLAGDVPSLHVIDGTPTVTLVTEPSLPRLAVRVPGGELPELSEPFTEIEDYV
jgi:hypothetical protein